MELGFAQQIGRARPFPNRPREESSRDEGAPLELPGDLLRNPELRKNLPKRAGYGII